MADTKSSTDYRREARRLRELASIYPFEIREHVRDVADIFDFLAEEARRKPGATH